MTPLRELQLAELRMLEKLILFLQENEIRYFILAGTLLGAVRHKGFIPWDDDIDIGVPRKDYDRLIELAKTNLEIAGLPVKFYPFDNTCTNYPLKVIDKKVVIKKKTGETVETTNAWITLFPLDGMPTNVTARKIHSVLLLWRRFAYVMARYRKIVDVDSYRYKHLKKSLVKLVGMLRLDILFDEQKTFEKITKDLKRFPFDSSEYVICLMGGYKLKELFPKQVFGKGKLYEFEGMSIIGPEDYDTYLKQIYGDYMIPPSEDNPIRNSHNVLGIEIK